MFFDLFLLIIKIGKESIPDRSIFGLVKVNAPQQNSLSFSVWKSIIIAILWHTKVVNIQWA